MDIIDNIMNTADKTCITVHGCLFVTAEESGLGQKSIKNIPWAKKLISVGINTQIPHILKPWEPD